jgi:Icc-related predicted phosphoesterase
MKILAVADIHGAQYRLNLVLKNIERYSPDFVVICGDITQFGPGELAKNLLNQISVETLAIPGNIDTADVNKGIDDSKAINILMKRVVKKGIPFVGISGTISKQLKIIDEKKLLDETSVLVSHEPPYGAQDKIFLGMHTGSKELKEIVEKYKPRLLLCGHIHEDPGFTKIGQTAVVNCSLGKRGEGALIDINEKISVKMLD